MKRYDAYNPFAWLYANYWGGDFHGQIVRVLQELVLHLVPKKAEVLDLCCGDGRLARRLCQLKYRVTGLDGSEELVAFARHTAPEVEFVLGDARDFVFADRRFRLVVSTFDSLNHVHSGRDLEKVFRCVFHCLEPGGYFAFDLNREEAYLHLWSHVSGSSDEDAVSVARGSYDRRKRLALCEITLFRKERGLWQRSDFSLTQRHHPHETVMKGLRRAGFRQIASLDAASDLGMTGNIGQFRTFYLARKDGAGG